MKLWHRLNETKQRLYVSDESLLIVLLEPAIVALKSAIYQGAGLRFLFFDGVFHTPNQNQIFNFERVAIRIIF
jgi:hypothetical protein